MNEGMKVTGTKIGDRQTGGNRLLKRCRRQCRRQPPRAIA